MPNQTFLKPLFVVASVAALLLIPLVAMQFSSEVNWGLEDFVAAAFLLLGTGAGIALVLRYVKSTGHRVALIVLLAFALAVIWAQLAVGIFT